MERFLEGELIDLYIPNLDFIKENKTYEWWNNPRVTKFLESGTTINTLEKQIDYFKNTKNLVFFFSDKEQIVGTVMIQEIDNKRKCGEIGFVRGVYSKEQPLQSVEAMAHTMEHAFDIIGLERIFAKHHIGHIPFSHILSLLGYKLEGIFRNDFIKQDWSEINDRIHTVCHRKDYEIIKENRNGKLWDSQRKMLSRVRQLPKKPIHSQLDNFFKQFEQYYNEIFCL